MFNLGGASLSIKVSRIDSCPYYFKANLLKLALKSCGLDTSGSRNELG